MMVKKRTAKDIQRESDALADWHARAWAKAGYKPQKWWGGNLKEYMKIYKKSRK